MLEFSQDLSLKTEFEWHECGDKNTNDNMLVIIAFLKEKYIGYGEFIIQNNRLLPNNIEITAEFRRKGIATRIYVKAEEITGLIIKQPNIQSHDGRLFWAQTSRPLG